MYVSPLFKTLCLMLIFSYTSLYVSPLILDYVNKINSLSLLRLNLGLNKSNLYLQKVEQK